MKKRQWEQKEGDTGSASRKGKLGQAAYNLLDRSNRLYTTPLYSGSAPDQHSTAEPLSASAAVALEVA